MKEGDELGGGEVGVEAGGGGGGEARFLFAQVEGGLKA